MATVVVSAVWTVQAGDESVDYQIPNLLAAIDELVRRFVAERGVSQESAVNALELYAHYLETET